MNTIDKVRIAQRNAAEDAVIASLPPALRTARVATVGERVLAILDELKDEAAAHMYPDDLEKFSCRECTAVAYSVRVGSPDGKSVPLFTREQVVEALRAAGIN